MKDFNLIAFGSDSYKYTHHPLLPDGTEVVYAYCEPRAGAMFPETVFFGLQYILLRYLAGQVVTQEKIDEAAEIAEMHFGSPEVFNREGWEYILAAHGGRLPVRIKALPEGTVVPEGTALFTIENTDPRVPWLTNFLETILMHVWSPTTVASSSRAIKSIIFKYLDLTGDPAGLPFKLHDFGYRGVSSVETAALAGAAHLVNFMGTDTLAAIPLLRDYYDAEGMPAFSIPATEHSIMTAGGPDGEADIVRRILKTYPKGLVAMVGDSFNMRDFILKVIGENQDIMDMIRNREGTVVIRPDSGEIPQIDISVFEALETVFGSETNAKGFRVLPPYVRMIQGDGIEWYDGYDGSGQTHTVKDILAAFRRRRISADNIAFGSGGGLLQKFNRDTQRFAIKCSAMRVNGKWQDIFKQPQTDPTKNSKRGRLFVYRQPDGRIVTTNNEQKGAIGANMLQTKFENGRVLEIHSLDEIRYRAALPETAEV